METSAADDSKFIQNPVRETNAKRQNLALDKDNWVSTCSAETGRDCDYCRQSIIDLVWWQCECGERDLHLWACEPPQKTRKMETHDHWSQQCRGYFKQELHREDPMGRNHEILMEQLLKYGADAMISCDLALFHALRGIQEVDLDSDGATRLSWKIIHYLLNRSHIKMLSLDGGGIRGYFTMKVIGTLIKKWADKDINRKKIKEFETKESKMKEKRKSRIETKDSKEDQSQIKECEEDDLETTAQRAFMDQFDSFVGTSAGGLLAFCLSIGYPLKKVIRLFEDSSYYFVPTSNVVSSTITKSLPVFGNKYNPDRIHKMIDTIVKWAEYRHKPMRTLGDLNTYLGRKQLLITAFDWTTNQALILNSADANHAKYVIADVLKSTMAAPTYFPPHPILTPQGEKHFFVDGGVFANDPTLAGLFAQFVSSNFMSDDDKELVSKRFSILSIGTVTSDSAVKVAVEPTWWKQPWQSMKKKMAQYVDGGIVDWILNRDLIGSLFQANASLSDAIITRTGNRHVFRRFRFNFKSPQEMPLDDTGFVNLLNEKYADTIENAPEMSSMLHWVEEHLDASRDHLMPKADVLQKILYNADRPNKRIHALEEKVKELEAKEEKIKELEAKLKENNIE